MTEPHIYLIAAFSALLIAVIGGMVGGAISSGSHPQETCPTQTPQTLSLSPESLTALKLWNSLNQGVQELPLDKCSSLKRINAHEFKVTLGAC